MGIWAPVDRIAQRWLDWRLKRQIEIDPKLREFKIKSMECHDKAMTLIGTAPGFVVLIEECAKLMAKYDAQNYLEFKALCRTVSPPRIMRITLQWEDGESPGDRAARLEEEVRALGGEKL